LLEERTKKEAITAPLKDSEVITDDDIKGAAGTLYVAGQDTVSI